MKYFINSPPFVPAFIASLIITISSEIGDKTFFIAAVLSMKHPHLVVWGGASVALFTMTLLSVAVGYALPSLLSRNMTQLASILLFLFFGVQLIRQSIYMSKDDESDELQEVEKELCGKDTVSSSSSSSLGSCSTPMDRNTHIHTHTGMKLPSNIMAKFVSRIFIQAFTMTFIAEWGDRSQIATIALAASMDPVGVSLGCCIGHGICTALAVIGGRMLAASISEKAVHMIGGVLFIIFGVVGIISTYM
eukprot:GHVR01016998.1.p1 GENE.GHVR01016998.1~~GHVR01016998.1.p1  ORF type:complete len:248 (-),score=63.75 GHVR01016998.1:181-924(-)